MVRRYDKAGTIAKYYAFLMEIEKKYKTGESVIAAEEMKKFGTSNSAFACMHDLGIIKRIGDSRRPYRYEWGQEGSSIEMADLLVKETTARNKRIQEVKKERDEMNKKKIEEQSKIQFDSFDAISKGSNQDPTEKEEEINTRKFEFSLFWGMLTIKK